MTLKKWYVYLSFNTSVLFLFLCFLIACTPPRTKSVNDPTPDIVVFDTVQKAHIDELVDTINSGLRKIGMPQKLAYPLYNPNDTIASWFNEGNKSARISIEWKLPEEIKWPTFFVYDGELVFIRFRNMINSPTNRSAFESMIYLKGGKIIYCEERGMPLNPGEPPGLLHQLPYSISTHTYAEIESNYKESWELLKAYMKKNNAFPSYIKD